MDLKALKQLQQQSKSLQSQRHQGAANLYQQGLEAFAQAAGQNFRDKQALKKAFDCWMEAIKSHRQNPEPCIGVGYIFMILGDTRTALMYFKSAQRLQPNHPDAALFIDYLVKQAAQKKPGASTPVKTGPMPVHPSGIPPQPVEKPITDTDFDTMYERAEHLLDFHLKQVMGTPAPKPCLTEEDRQTQLQLCEAQQDIVTEIKTILQTIADEIDTSELEKRLLILERSLKRLQNVCALSEKFAHLADRIQNSRQQAMSHLVQLNRGTLTNSEQLLESLLDSCDQFADELESIENQKHSIAELEPLYQNLIETVTLLQERLDEH